MGTVITPTPAKGAAKVPYTAAPAPPKGEGWVLFASIMFMVAACLNLIWGIAAVSDSKFFVGNATFIVSSLNTWGWIAICYAVLQFAAAASIWRGGAFGRWFGIGIASIALLIAMLSIPAYPLWSLTLIAIDLLIIYGLAAYGGKPELTS